MRVLANPGFREHGTEGIQGTYVVLPRKAGAMEVQVSEVVDLVLGLAVLPLLVVVAKRTRNPGGRRGLKVGYGLVLAANTFTIIEGVGGPAGEWLNFAEHASLAMAGGAFLWSVLATRDAILGHRATR